MFSWKRARGWVIQAILLALLVVAVVFFVFNARQNLAAQAVGSGFDFLGRPAGFDVSQSLIDLPPDSSYRRILVVGLLNTAVVSLISAAAATLLGLGVAVLALSTSRMLRGIARVYVEAMRNLPPLFHVFFWYVVLLRLLPPARASWDLFGVAYLNIQGLYLPRIGLDGVELPVLEGFGFTGGVRLVPEFFVLTLALALYTAGFIAELVRAGIRSVPQGQVDAAAALGLSRLNALRLVLLPQALRLVVPPLTSQYLNLLKNSSLAVAIGYPDLTALFAGITLNQTGQAIEVIGITMMCYLAASAVTSTLMNIYNQRVVRRGQ